MTEAGMEAGIQLTTLPPIEAGEVIVVYLASVMRACERSKPDRDIVEIAEEGMQAITKDVLEAVRRVSK